MIRKLCLLLLILLLNNNTIANTISVDIGNFIQLPLDSFSLTVNKTISTPKIDGKLDDDCWNSCLRYSNFTQIVPLQEAEASDSTSFYLTFDSENLYIAVQCYDSEPDKIIANISSREDIGNDDLIEIMLDTHNDGRSCYLFDVNPLGIQGDGIQTLTSNDNSWDGVWSSVGKVTDYGWQVEIKIPIKILRFPNKKEQIWRIQIMRLISRSGEVNSYVPIRINDNNQLERMAIIKGITNLSSNRLLDITPYFTGDYKNYKSYDIEKEVKVGADIKYGLTSDIIVDATVNPDFGHIEADKDYINLTPYELYLQEKRLFFLEKNEIFSTPLQLFYSRRISNPDIGVKFSGETGSLGFGTLYSKNDNVFENAKEDFFISRIEYKFWKQSYFGFMSTYLNKSNYSNKTLSFDYNFVKGPFILNGQLAKSSTTNIQNLDWNGHFTATFNRNNIFINYGHSFIEKNFIADAGFINPAVIDLQFTPLSYRTDWVNSSYAWYINKLKILQITPSFSYYYRGNYDGNKMAESFNPALAFSFINNIGLSFASSFEKRLWESSYYDISAYSISVNAYPNGKIGGNIYYSEGKSLDYWSNSSVWDKQVSFSLIINPSTKIEFSPSIYYVDRFTSRHGNKIFSQWNGSVRFGYHFTKDLFYKMYLQGNTSSDYYTSNILLGYTFMPGSTIYLAYNSDYLYQNGSYNLQKGIMFLKISVLLNL